MLRAYRFAGYTKKTIRYAGAYRAELVKVRSLGFALDDEEFEEGLRCIGAPVRDHTGKVVAAISIAGPSFRITPERRHLLIAKVVAAARDLSETLGCRRAAPQVL
jgi:DNA-binding IclR family transcriptional regulator